MTPELKPCPYCGGKTKVKVCDGSGAYYTDIGTKVFHGRGMTHCLVQCEKCGIKTKAYLTRRGVFTAWNRRVGENHD